MIHNITKKGIIDTMDLVTKLSESVTLDDLEYEELKKLAFDLLAIISDDQSFYLGIGRTPTPLIAFLQCYLGKEVVGQIPLSGFRHNYPGENYSLLREPLSETQLEILEEHLNKFLPSQLITDDLSLIVIDFVDSGASLAAITHHIRKYLQDKGVSADKVKAAALCKPSPPICFLELMDKLDIKHYDFSIPGDENNLKSLGFKLGKGKHYDPISPYNRSFKLSLGHHPDELVQDDSMYCHFLSMLSGKMMNDLEITEPLRDHTITCIKEESHKVEKICSTKQEATRLWGLFKTFPNHTHPYLVDNKVIYDFVKASMFQEIILSKHPDSFNNIKQLANVLGNFHWKHLVTVANYDKICFERKFYERPEVYLPSYGYFTQIHGDCHLRNILITGQNNIVIIDRLRKCGDLMYDFSFILSLLCLGFKYQDSFFINLIGNFFYFYERYIDDKKNFYTAFRNNLLNYALFAYKTYQNSSPPFEEWKYGREISEELANYPEFKGFVQKKFGIQW
ncbi:phosphotransferase [Nostoc sp.]